jgi:hypothetical protein
MDRESLLILAVSMLIAAAAVVGISGWVLFARDRRLAKVVPATMGAGGAHPEAPEER